jgi:hypothetical protein
VIRTISFETWQWICDRTHLIGQRGRGGSLQLFLVDGLLRSVDLDLGGTQSGSSDEVELGVTVTEKPKHTLVITSSSILFHMYVPNKLPGQPQERLFEVVVRLRGDLVILQVLLSVESNSRGLHLSLLKW